MIFFTEKSGGLGIPEGDEAYKLSGLFGRV
jgi:hypothetical protein